MDMKKFVGALTDNEKAVLRELLKIDSMNLITTQEERDLWASKNALGQRDGKIQAIKSVRTRVPGAYDLKTAIDLLVKESGVPR